MTDPQDLLQRERIEAVLALAAQHPSATQYKGMIDGFGREYFARQDPEDLQARTPEDLLGALLAHLQLGDRRLPGQTLVRALSPSMAEHGWASRHTVIDIVNDDMPFLVDTTTMEINRHGLTLHLLVHPIFAVERDAEGQLLSIRPRHAGDTSAATQRESWMHIEVDRLVDSQQRHDLVSGIEQVLADVRRAVQDWQAMVTALRTAMLELERDIPGLPPEQVRENRAFLEWLADDHMTLLGYRQHELITQDGGDALRLVPGSGLGLLRETTEEKLSASFAQLPANARAMARAQQPMLLITKANTRSTVHRPGYTDYVGIKRYDAAGQVIGEHRFIGLFTSTAYSARVSETPLLRGRTQAITERAGLPPGGHLAKALQHILETYPRDDLFQISDDELFETSLGILALGERQRLRLFVCHDPFERFVSCLVYVPREAYSTDLRIKFQAILMAVLKGSSAEFDVQLSNAVLARIHFTVRTTPGELPHYDKREVEAKLAAAARRWDDELRDALIDAEGEARGLELYKRWAGGFPLGYRERVSARAAVPDVLKFASLTPASPLALALYRPMGAQASKLGFKVYHHGPAVVLSDSLPMLEHMGVRVFGEANYRIVSSQGALEADAEAVQISLHDFELQAQAAEDIDPDALSRLFEDTFARVFKGEVENDDLNRLVLRAGLSCDDIVVLRAYAKYLRQIGFALSQSAIEATLAAHPRIARMLVTLFKLRFHPDSHDEQGATAQVNGIEKALEKVSNLQDDRVLRQLLALVQATLRTNFWRTGPGHSGEAGPRRPFLSFKFDSARVPGLPAPRPLYEIFVYSPRFEGIHLRGGKVARGGLRWSDRPEDFRTEVLGLVKAQMVKNTVIVPVGSKGGFVLKKAPPSSDREAFMKEGVACYQDYLRALLDLTDNLSAGQVVPPPQVVRKDADDPYLVVAADKGTATFSDYANAVSAEYGHWLGDAFASGGSVGYDHKAMGITARGAWESVKRHFREVGLDTQTTAFTVVGVGDMSGDVFGNGMLLSRHIRLLAAFDHRHVFIDPNPDTALSFAERERLFKLPRSAWTDYDASLISAGGGVWARSEKSIPISPQAQAALGITVDRLPPNDLLSAILKAPVDLLYNGGIGTYIKASTESHAEVGDRANDGLRIDGAELRCKVVGEGGNLGATQRGRIEAALNGVSLNTDAIDNSAGVDTSDHEVNIKILLGLAMGDGEMTLKQRNTLLPQMTEEVAGLVLRDNYFQTQALSIARRQGVSVIDAQARFIRFLERKGQLNRAIEFLPSDEQIEERKARGVGLSNPELAVLLAYSKMWLSDELMASDLPEDAWIGTAVERYFPALLREKFAGYIPRHPLKREIIVTHVLNSMLNRVGPTFVHRMTEATGSKAAQVVRAYLATREVFGYVSLWLQIEALDNRVPDAVQAEMIEELGRLGQQATTWFLRSRRLGEPMGQVFSRFTPAVDVMRTRLADAPSLATAQAWTEAGVPAALAHAVAQAERLYAALDIAEVADTCQRSLDEVAEVHASLGERLGLARLHQQIAALPADSYWQTQAKMALGDDLAGLQRGIAVDVLNGGQGAAPHILSDWEQRKGEALERAGRLLSELGEAKGVDLAMVSVALRELRNLA
ncbi:NAD-glutamate dehydrogenase [Roseateles koreensis]|uniref:NAD-glutamate dehydrogenase n=1 Tax=Roseateles koreensis TaxID=2987526 RepID=A0ABT5KQ41_9BURK|nr:NAD-glutamate dehydrogenase [Roseateles koreensis]MDC8784493.1 NAD-glutamate dehydrogenase [Roseateles koreensis]